ncbi:DNA replication and repair protein RecF [Sporotomaculum syntrophicum]|uniref:DNA replication and repair protein RecF n=1 Tax=Sporotomaculum syntrophicum TaxID=182264 RepID=A0A9D3AZH4_9FIRM|nr:DNA replication/repair protein RecF [Sporotomaculum syntrophicum]KAF1085904.1 DNA replication and repair protein RecF [Sporotomaculum syntrophicum]
MILKNLNINSFRNYKTLHWEPHPGINLITGLNAQGKTNLLEAIYYSGLGYSFRKKASDVINWQSKNASIKAVYQLNNINMDISLHINHDEKKLLINGSEEKRKFLPGRFGIVLFKPDDLQIIKGPPSIKRDFIDRDIGMLEPVYLRDLMQYRRVVEQRNYLLRNGIRNNDSFHVWSESFYQYGSKVLSGRIKLLQKYIPLVQKTYALITGGNEELEMKYLSTLKITSNTNIEQIIQQFKSEGKTRQKEELYKKQTTFGPHRDDIIFLVNNKDARYYASQGQIRSIVLALKTAQITLFYNENGEYPILLLDDVLMELDDQRQQYLFKLISNHVQSFITTTQMGKNSNYVNRVYLINNGKIREVV